MYDSGRPRRGVVFHRTTPLFRPSPPQIIQRDELFRASYAFYLPPPISSTADTTPAIQRTDKLPQSRWGQRASPHPTRATEMPVEPELTIQGWRDRGKLGPRTRQPQYTGAPSLGPRRPRNSAGGVGFKFSRVENTGERRGGRGEDSRTQQPEPKRTAFGTTSKGEGPQAATGAHHQGWAQLEGHRTDMPCKGVMIPVGSGVHVMWHERRRPDECSRAAQHCGRATTTNETK